MMTVETRSGLACSADGVPRGWKIISARVGAAVSTFYISPHGKRFSSLDAVKRYVEKFPQVALLSTRSGKPSKTFFIMVLQSVQLLNFTIINEHFIIINEHFTIISLK